YNSAQIVLKHINTLGILSDLALQIKTLTGEQNTLLISDSNMLLNKIIDDSDAPFVYERTGLNIDHFMIDEFQDTSVLQWKNFRPLLDNSLADGNTNLVVGDVKQSIYRWRNSDWKLLDETIMRDFGTEQIREENLDTNWRSDRNIVNFNNTFFGAAAEILQEKLNEKIDPLLAVYPDLENLRHKITHAYENIYQKTAAKVKEGYVRFEFIPPDDNGENWKEKSLNCLPSLLEDLQDRGYAPENICLLTRKNDEEQAIIEKLLRYKTSADAKPGYCYDVMGNEGLLIDSAASVRFILALLRLFVDSGDRIRQTIVSYEYARGRQSKTPAQALDACFAAKPEDFSGFSHLFSVEEQARLEEIRYLSLFDMVERIIALFDLGNWYNEAVFIQAFQNSVFQYSVGKTADLNSFLAWWDAKGAVQYVSAPDGQQAFRIMTIHKSKGLDFNVVVIPFADWDLDSRMRNILWCKPAGEPFDELPLLPVEYTSKLEKTIFSELYFDEKMHQYIDSLNLAYVAFTRAKHELICFTPEIDMQRTGETDKINSLAALLHYCLRYRDNSGKENGLQLSGYYDDDTACFELGKMEIRPGTEEKERPADSKIDGYPSVSSAGRLHVRRQSLDYWMENREPTGSRLNYGLIMHDILRQVKYREDEENAIQTLVTSGRINEADAAFIREELKFFWQLPEAADWFAPGVRALNETSILTPSGALYRPDRVVIRGNKATVIDYKFGNSESPAYITQVKSYMDLIARMNYETEGFVCYVTLRKTVKV
ncbi:MAG: UvrD-helicase domain-containing protein, partial [Prevotellaceae bacterium]|nr:UvrD-helicase domain-containing protein [Prevotellaceae bacterium]